VALSELAVVSLDNRRRPSRWVLCQPGVDDLEIPVNAIGAEALFDAFAALPEFPVDVMLQQLRHPSDNKVVIWRSTGSIPQFRLED